MDKVELNGMVYEFDDGLALMFLLDENADRVYEGTGVQKVHPNAPLTLEELRGMDGEPVWCVSNARGIVRINCWTIVSVELERCAGNTVWLNFEDYGDWLAYRSKPEEGTT